MIGVNIVSDKDKGEEYHKKWATHILNNEIDGVYDLSYSSMQMSYEYYDGTQGNDAFNFLQEAENGDALPASWITYNSIRTKVDALVEELRQYGYEIKVKAINKDAVSKRLNKKDEIRAKMMMRKDMLKLQDLSGLPLVPPENLPKTEEELDDYITYEYKSDSEKVMTAALTYLAKKYEWERKRLVLFKDLVITGRCFTRAYVDGGMVRYDRIDPRNMIFDRTSTDDLLRDSTYFGYIEYMPLAEAIQKWQLTNEEAQDIVGRDYNNRLNRFVNQHSSVEYYSGDDNGKVLVFHCQFMDYEVVKRKVSVDKFGNTHYKKVDKKAKGDDIKSVKVKTWRQCTLLGGEVVKDWGIKKNMIRSIDDLFDTRSDYSCLVHNYVNGKSISKVDQIKGLQDAKDIAMYNLQLAMNRAGSKGFFYDVSMLPNGWEVEDALYYLKSVGISFYNSLQDGVQRNMQNMQPFDQTISTSINQYLSIIQMYDSQIALITGMSDERMGNVMASQAVGVTQTAVLSSKTVTGSLFSSFKFFSDDLFSSLAGLCKIVMQHSKENFAMIIGDSGVNFLDQDVDLHLNDYGVFIDTAPPLMSDSSKLEQLAHAGLQTGGISFVDYIEFMNEKDNEYRVRKLKRAIQNRIKEDQQMAMQQKQAEQEGAMEAEQEALNRKAQMAEIQTRAEAQRSRNEISMKHQNDMENNILNARLGALSK